MCEMKLLGPVRQHPLSQNFMPMMLHAGHAADAKKANETHYSQEIQMKR